VGLTRDLLDVLLPTPCAVCGELAGDGSLARLCAACEAQLPRQAWPLQTRIPCVAAGWYLASYRGVGGDLIRTGKYGRREALLAEIAALCAGRMVGALPAVEAVVAVPTPWPRRAVRGFSAPDLLADAIARTLERPRLGLLARRLRPRQAGLDRGARWANAAGSVRLRGPVEGEPTLLLVDDVVTTGATASACAEVLLLGGARRVYLCAFASALP
jgi:predicted amidophosphoribosyltransferase